MKRKLSLSSGQARSIKTSRSSGKSGDDPTGIINASDKFVDDGKNLASGATTTAGLDASDRNDRPANLPPRPIDIEERLAELRKTLKSRSVCSSPVLANASRRVTPGLPMQPPHIYGPALSSNRGGDKMLPARPPLPQPRKRDVDPKSASKKADESRSAVSGTAAPGSSVDRSEISAVRADLSTDTGVASASAPGLDVASETANSLPIGSTIPVAISSFLRIQDIRARLANLDADDVNFAIEYSLIPVEIYDDKGTVPVQPMTVPKNLPFVCQE